MGVLPVDLHCILLTHRFLVVIDMLKPENLESSSVLQGCSYIDVPSSAKEDYQLTFLSYKEGVFSAKVSEDTGLQGPSRSGWLTEKLDASFHASMCTGPKKYHTCFLWSCTLSRWLLIAVPGSRALSLVGSVGSIFMCGMSSTSLSVCFR